MAGITYRDRNKDKLDKQGRKKKPNWSYSFEKASIDGKRSRTEVSGFRTKQDAISAGVKAYNEYMGTGKTFTPTRMSFSDALDEYIKGYASIECVPETVRGYEKKIRLYIKPTLGEYYVGSVDTAAIQSLINSLVERKISRNTISSVKGIISSCLKYSKRMGWVLRNESADAALPSIRASRNLTQKKREPLSKEAITDIFNRFPDGHSCYKPLLLGYKAGTRLGETFGICWDDFDFDSGTVKIQRQVQWIKEKKAWQFLPPKYDSYREIDLDEATLAYFRSEKRRHASLKIGYGSKYVRYFYDEYGFLNTDGRGKEIWMLTIRDDGSYIQPRVMQHCSKVVHKELGYPKFDFHTLRHTHATELAESGVHLKEIQRRLGHKTLEVTTRTYLHATELMRKQTVGILNSMYR